MFVLQNENVDCPMTSAHALRDLQCTDRITLVKVIKNKNVEKT